MEIWTEKYRPKKLSEVVGQKEIVEKLKAFVKNKSMPHLLFAGPAGVGKTTCALAIARELYGENWKANFLELNASDERGIDTIRTKVKEFARTLPIGDVPFKIILLDEADALTRDAQQALRRMMEKYTDTCRFILNCNYSSKIIPPIQSRCAIFRFSPLSLKDVEEYIKRIEKGEKIKLSKESIEALYEVSEGDLRRLTNILQSVASVSKKITPKEIYEISGVVLPQEVEPLIEAAEKREFEKVKKILLEIMYKKGLSGLDLVKLIARYVWESKIENEKKMKLMEAIGETEYRIVEGGDDFIQILALLSHFG